MTHCKNCPFKHHRGACSSEPNTSRRPILALVGEAPGFTELHEGQPFSPRGASGRLLMETLKELQLGRNECWIGNAVNCDARTTKDLEKSQPVCAGRLVEELKDLPASAVIVPLGSNALRSVLGRRAAAILKFRGSVTRLETGPLAGRIVVPSVHPAYALRVPAYREVLRRDLERAVQIQADGWEAPDAARPMSIVRTLEELDAELSYLGDEVAFDVETTFDGPLWNDLICFTLSDGDRGVVVPWARERSGKGCIWERPVAVADIVTSFLKKRLAVTHNGPQFDWIVAERYGIRPKETADTLIAFHAIHGELPKNLGFVTSYYVPCPAWKTEEGKHAAFPQLFRYNFRDGIYTALAWRGIKQELEAA